jgi:hypothetical protein
MNDVNQADKEQDKQDDFYQRRGVSTRMMRKN